MSEWETCSLPSPGKAGQVLSTGDPSTSSLGDYALSGLGLAVWLLGDLELRVWVYWIH